jgi:ferrochelatase
MTTPATALLLLNLGTPEAPDTASVRPYLREFLMDGRVISIPGAARWMLVNGIIAPFRAPKSAHAYQRIWTDDGSPLLAYSQQLTEAVRARLDADADAAGVRKVQVELAMRYGEPSVKGALERFAAAGTERIVVFPLYPQYASATSGSSIEKVMDELREQWALPSVSFVPAFFEHPAFLDAAVAAGEETLEEMKPDHVLFSFHGLPEDHLTRTDPTGRHCLKSDGCCDVVTDSNRFCYRAQCVATARGLAERLGLADEGWSLSFQSRLGKQEWIKPYTDATVEELAKAGKKRLAVFCPAFVADCLETLEEIGMEAKESFTAAGGEDLALVPCVNAHPTWVNGVLTLAREASGWLPPAANDRPDT